jgi:hypothetical protein
MRAEIIGIFPVSGTGLTWVSGSIEFEFDPRWSDDLARAVSPIRGILHPVTRDKFVAPSSLAAIFVPATPTGQGQIPGPAITMRYSLIDSAGMPYNNSVFFPDGLSADGLNQWNVNQRAIAPTFVTSPGPAPIGLTQALGDARYFQQTAIIPATALAAHASRHAPGGVDPITNLGSLTILNPAGNTGIEFGKTSAVDAPQFDSHSSGNPNDFDVRLLFTGGGVTNGQGTLNVQGLNFQWNGSNMHTLVSVAALNNIADQPTTLPTIIYAAGGGSAANLTQAAAPVIIPIDAKELLVKLDYNWNLASTTQFSVSVPSAGYTITTIQFGAYKTGGEAIPQTELPLDSLRATFAGTTGRVVAIVRLRRTA